MADPSQIEQTEPSLRQEVSRAFVQLVREFYGKGPDQSKTLYSGDIVLVVMRGGFTSVERTLRDNGRGAAVTEQRTAFHEVMEGRFRDVIERLTGRKVIAGIYGSHQEPDLIAEMFVLEPHSPDDLLHEP
jgi:uncharacterized protein YbcI